jgi:hypothetical protein
MRLPVPIRIKPTRKCPRCELRYPLDSEQCPHCSGLSDREVDELKLKVEQEHEAHANLGKLLLYLAALIAIGMMLLL